MTTTSKPVFQRIVTLLANASWIAMMIPPVKLLVFRVLKLNMLNAHVRFQKKTFQKNAFNQFI